MKKLNLLKSMMLLCMLMVGMGAWAKDVVYKTALFGSSYNSKSVSAYNASWSATNDGFTVNLVNWNNNNNGWSYIKAGNKSTAYVATITNATAIDKAVTKIAVTIDAVTANNINSIKLYTGDAENSCTTEIGNITVATGVKEISLPTPAANKFYMLSFDCKAASNGSVQVSKVQYYVSDGGAATPKYNVNVANNIAHGSVAADPILAEENTTISLTATPEAGYMLDSWNVTTTSTSEPVAVTDDEFTMPAADVNVSATFTTIPEKTIAEFIASEGGTCYLTGIVSNIASTKYGNFDLTDESGTIYVYGCLTPAGVAQQFSTLDIVEGDKIKVLADEFTVYQEKNEAINVIFVEEIEVEKPKYVVTIATPENGTLVVKEGETVLTSGDEVEEGKTLTVECTPEAGYRYQNWQYKEAGNWITMTSTMTRTVTQAISIRANFEEIPTYTVAWNVNGSVVKSENLLEGAAVTAPAVEDINDKVFVGWATTSSVDADEPEMVTPMTTATAAATYYAVFATLEDEGEITYTKVTNNTFDTSAEYVLAAEESSTSSTLHYFSSYTGTTANESWGVTSTDVDDAIVFTLSGTADALVAEDASGNYLQALATGKFRMSSASTTLTYKTDGTIYNPSSSSYNLRYNHNNGSGGFRWYSGTTGTSAYFYKKEGGATYSGYTTTVAAPVTKTIDFYAAGEDGYYTTFSNDKAVSFPDMIEVDGEYAQFTVYSVYAVGDMLELQDLKTTLHSDDTWYLSENEGYLIKAEYSGDVTYTGEAVISVEYTELNYDLNSNDAENFLRPASEAKSGDNKFYMLAYSDNNCTPASLGFYWGAADGAAFVSRDNSAYLALPKDTQAKGFRFSDAETNGIKNVESTIFNNAAYNLNGQRVNANAKGIVIVNGKKVLNK